MQGASVNAEILDLLVPERSVCEVRLRLDLERKTTRKTVRRMQVAFRDDMFNQLLFRYAAQQSRCVTSFKGSNIISLCKYFGL